MSLSRLPAHTSRCYARYQKSIAKRFFTTTPTLSSTGPIRPPSNNADVLYSVGAVITTFLGLSYLAVPLYKILCQRTGIDGTPMTKPGSKFDAETMVPLLKERAIKVTFDASLAGKSV